MKVIIAGSREITDKDEVFDAVFKSGMYPDIDEIVSGGARGVDSIGEQFAMSFDLKLTVFKADWNTHGKGAGYIRNRQMAKYADALIAIWDGKSRGTKHMIEEMNKLKKKVYVYENSAA